MIFTAISTFSRHHFSPDEIRAFEDAAAPHDVRMAFMLTHEHLDTFGIAYYGPNVDGLYADHALTLEFNPQTDPRNKVAEKMVA